MFRFFLIIYRVIIFSQSIFYLYIRIHILSKIHFETGECRNNVLAMEYIDNKMRLEF